MIAKVPLNARQRQALPVLDWLLSSDEADRRSGRSWLMAVALVRRAAREADSFRYWNFQDHLPEIPRSQQFAVIAPLVQQLIASDRRLSPHATYRRDGFRLQLPEPIDWLPPEPFLVEADYAELEMRMVAALGLTEEQLRNAEPNRLAADAVRRDTAMQNNFGIVYGQSPPPAHVIADEAVEPGVVLAVPVAAGLRRAMQRTAPPGALPQAEEARRASEQFTNRGVEPTDRVTFSVPQDWRTPRRASHSQMPSDASLVSPAGKQWIDGKAKGTMKLQVLKSRAPRPPPPTAWERIMGDEDAF